MAKTKTVVSLGHEALGSTTLEQMDAVKHTAKTLADLVEQHQVVADVAALIDLPRRFDVYLRDSAITFFHRHSYLHKNYTNLQKSPISSEVI